MVDVNFDVIIDGFEENKRIFFLTLTTDNYVNLDIFESFNKLIDKVNSLFGYDVGYFAVFTDEGNGVVHCLIKEYLPKAWYSDAWSKIHKSYVVRQEEPRSIDAISVYLYNQKGVVDVKFNKSWFPLKCFVDFDVDKSICRSCDDFRRCCHEYGIIINEKYLKDMDFQEKLF